MSRPRALHLPSEQNFGCSSCGRCCRAAWTIAVDGHSEVAIRASRSFADKARDGFVALQVVDDRLATARNADGTCTFLDAKHRCQLHTELGGHGKPLVCQTYPYLLTETPDGIFAALSYACPAVLQSLGPPLIQSQPQLEALIAAHWPSMPQGPPVSQQIEICRGRSVSWGEYLELESWLLERLEAERPVESLLTAAVELLYVARASSAAPLLLPTGALPPRLAGFDEQLASMVTCNLIALCEETSGDPQTRVLLGNMLWNGARHRSHRFGLELPTFSLHSPRTQELAPIIDRYLRQAVFGKRLLLGTVVSRLLALVCGMAFLLFYYEAFLADVEPPEALDRAFTLVESELLSHTRSFDGFFNEFEAALGNLLGYLAPAESV